MPRQRERRAALDGDHKRLKLDDSDVRVRAPTFHEFKDHSREEAISIWPFDPEHATQQKNEDGSILFTGPQDFSRPWPTFAIQVYTVNPLSDDLSEFLSPIVRHGRRSFRTGEWETRDAETSWRIDVYKQPLPDVYACIAHHKREITHRSNTTLSGLGGGSIHLYSKQANRARIIVLDPPDWSAKPIVLANFAARDRVPEQCPYELDLSVCAVDNVDGDNAMYQAIQEWISDAQREGWRLEASEQHSNPKPHEEPRITTIPKLDQEDVKGTVETQDKDIVCVKLRKDKAAPREAKFVYHVFHLESAELDSVQLGHSLLDSLTPLLPPGSAFDLLIHPSKPHIDACLKAFHALDSDAQMNHTRFFAIIDKHDFVKESGILFVQTELVKSAYSHVNSETGEMVAERLRLYEKWNNEHAVTVWRAYDVKRAALEFADPVLSRANNSS